MSSALDLLVAITRAESHLSELKRNLARIQASCQHTWTERYDPEIRKGYNDPGDPPGTMGVDRRLPSYIPPHETPRWSRHCAKCEKIEYSYRTKPPVEAKKIPDFGET